MGSKKIAAAALAALMLSGCAENEKERTPVSEQSSTASSSSSVSQSSSVLQSTGIVPNSSTQSGGAPSVIAPSFTGSSFSSEVPVDVPLPPMQSVPEVTPPEVTPPSGNSEVDIPAHYLVFEGSEITDEFCVKSGEVYLVSDTLTVSSGCSLAIENGGELYVSGTIKGDGDIIVSDGGKLTLASDEASLEGGGSLVIEGSFDDIDCTYGSVDIAVIPPERVDDDGVTTVGGVVIANKAIKLPPEYGTWLTDGEVSDETYNALLEMNSQSAHQYSIISAYRSYNSQERIFNGWVNMYGFEYASTISSQAGHSEHQTGLTMDLDSLEESYGDTAAGIWLAQNCYKYGFIIRYPKGKENITGYSYEPWHVRYLGKSTAKLVYSSGLTLEEFLNVEGGTEVID